MIEMLLPLNAYFKVELPIVAPANNMFMNSILATNMAGLMPAFSGIVAIVALLTSAPQAVIVSAVALWSLPVVFMPVTAVMARNFNKAWKQYGIDGYLAALQFRNPLKIKKELNELEERGIIEKGIGFTEKGKAGILARLDTILEICSRKEIRQETA